jgi:subtilase family serine protease
MDRLVSSALRVLGQSDRGGTATRSRESRRLEAGPGRLARSGQLPLLAAAVLLGLVSVAGCTGSPARSAEPASTTGITPAGVDSGCLAVPVSCYPPRLFQVAYGITPLLDEGIDGRGETVTVVAPGAAAGAAPASIHAPSPAAASSGLAGGGPATTDIRQDLAAFDSDFRLAPAAIQVVTSLAGAASAWEGGGQEVQDLQIVHAVAPAARLRVVLLPASAEGSAAAATASMLAGLRLAISGTDVALIGWSLGEHFFSRAQAAQMHSILVGAEADHVTVIASSGDDGGFSDNPFGGTQVAEVSLPASDPLVLAVGGSTLSANSTTGAYSSETAWNGQAGFSISSGASGGGFSHLYARPAYQDGLPRTGAMRGVPDVAGDADQAGGLSIIRAISGQAAISPAAGTDAAASLWAGVMALADQDAHHDLGLVNPAIYRIARGSGYHEAFHDVTTGSSVQTLPYPGGTAGYPAGPGWDPVTGWGSPNAQVLVPLLAA